MKKKKIIMVLLIGLLAIGIVLVIGKLSSTEKVEKNESKTKSSIKNVEKKKDDKENVPSEEEDKQKEENIIENNTNENTSVPNKNSSSSTNNGSSSSSNNNETTTGSVNTQNDNQTSTSNDISSATQPSQNSSSPQNITPPQTEWEKLGISEYAYYHTPMNMGEEVAFESDISVCDAEINRLINAYYREGMSGGNSYTVNGKYTYSYIGCGINIFINGIKYKYSQIKAMGYN